MIEPIEDARRRPGTDLELTQSAIVGSPLGAIDVRERVAELALTAKPDPHEQTPAYYDQTIGGRVYLAGQPPTANGQVGGR
jgi:hypothetical protein